MKSILMSIKPKWVEKIASGKKTVEVRKSVPKCGTPFKVYMYCTNKSKDDDEWQFKPHLYLDRKKRIRWIDVAFESIFQCEFLHGMVVGEFVCDDISYNVAFGHTGYSEYMNIEGSCLSKEELFAYGCGNMLYGLNISDLKIYDKPKALSEFFRPCPFKTEDQENDCIQCDAAADSDTGIVCTNRVWKAPQSWCYVEEL